MRGHADPALAAHLGPIRSWVEAVWNRWLPTAALRQIFPQAVAKLRQARDAWAQVHGPAAACVHRHGACNDFKSLRTDDGQVPNLGQDSPAFIRERIEEAVRKWRNRNIAMRVPSLAGDGSRAASYLKPVFDLLSGAGKEEGWGSAQRAGLKSALLNRQWTQGRLHASGKVDYPNCQLCVAMLVCSSTDPDPKFRGTLSHRTCTCLVLSPWRPKLVPQWLQDEMQAMLQKRGRPMSADMAFYTRALMPSPLTAVSERPEAATF